jgi:hypothetical protein
VLPVWCFTILDAAIDEETASAGEGASLLRVFRGIRILRLLRLAKLRNLLQALKDSISSERVFVLFYVGQLLLVVVFMNHFLGCMWYLVGWFGQDQEERNWVTDHGLRGAPLFSRYCTSFIWILSNFALGSTHVQPVNDGEKSLAILALLLGMITFSVITASITSAILKMQDAEGEKTGQFWLFRRYLRQNRVPYALNVRLLRYLEFKGRTSEQKVHESSLSILHGLSDDLHGELKCAVNFGPILRGHPLFAHMAAKWQSVIHSLAEGALSVKTFVEEDMIFRRGAMATNMHWVVSGKVIYHKKGDAENKVLVRPHDWACEMCLWVSWVNRGDMVALTDCTLVLVDTKLFRNAVQGNIVASDFMVEYASAYVTWLNEQQLESLTDITYRERGINFAGATVLACISQVDKNGSPKNASPRMLSPKGRKNKDSCADESKGAIGTS